MPERAPRSGSDKGSIFLTGATGFIGRRIQQWLLDDGWRVRVLSRPDSPGVGYLDDRAERIEGSLGKPAVLSRAVAGTAAVINCAGSVRGSSYAAFEPANVKGVANLCTALIGLEAPAPLLHLSSLAASEPDLSNYARSKWAGEQVLHEHESLCWTIIRPPAVYGPGDKEMRAALGWARRGIVPVAGADPHQRLSMLHVDDLAAAVAAWLEAPQNHRHQTYAIDDGKPDGYDWYEFAAAVARRRPRLIGLPTPLLEVFARANETLAGLSGRAVMLSRGKVRELTHPRWVADNGPFCSRSGWQPQISLAEGVSGLFES